MDTRLNSIADYLAGIEFVRTITPLYVEKDTIKGVVALTVENVSLEFSVEIKTQYPSQYHDAETIRFVNTDLISYNHVNWDGSICIHTLHSPDLYQKLDLDFCALRYWIHKYYINKEQDTHYEHIVVPHQIVDGKESVMLFTDVDHQFTDGDFGITDYCYLADGVLRDHNIATYLLQAFRKGGTYIKCKWNGYYSALPKKHGVFLYINKPPVNNRRFAFSRWDEFEGLFTQEFSKFLYDTLLGLKKAKATDLNFMLGYPISDTEVHWELIIIKKDKTPIYAEKIKGTKSYSGTLQEHTILWGQTRNSSYEHFFGRGALDNKLTQSKVLIIGVGAVGSIVANTLCRGGCISMCLLDHDVKEPENVCRSEYQFQSGINNKVEDLKNQLVAISPFVEVIANQFTIDIVKLNQNDGSLNEDVLKFFNYFDLIFDCTTDNDLAYILDSLNLNSKIINLSITNHAKELVCATNPDLYKWLMHIFNTLSNDTDDLYNPTGCWSPTFKAGYNDISVLVQFAIKQINLTFKKGMPLRNFYLSTPAEEDFAIKLNQF